jgi:RNA polymerase sigma-70 factor, ECF subfamily
VLLDHLSDAELVKKVQKNHRASSHSLEAVSVLYDRHHERIFRYLLIRVNDHHQAEDLTGEVFIRMLNALPDYQERSAPFEAWLYRIARNLLIDSYRKESAKKMIPIDEVVGLPTAEDLDSRMDDKWSLETVRKALEKIEPAQREVIELRFLVGLPAHDVALILEKTISAVKALQHRGLNNLRLAIEKMEARYP